MLCRAELFQTVLESGGGEKEVTGKGKGKRKVKGEGEGTRREGEYSWGLEGRRKRRKAELDGGGNGYWETERGWKGERWKMGKERMKERRCRVRCFDAERPLFPPLNASI